MTNNIIHIFTDGACCGNPGEGGYGIVFYSEHDNIYYESSGYSSYTTNNQMELTAVIFSLQLIQNTYTKDLLANSIIDVYSDSQYVVNAYNKSWIRTWKLRGWKTSDGKDVKNIDLWNRLIELTSDKIIQWHWVKGHDGIQHNERCDELAKNAIKLKFKESNNG